MSSTSELSAVKRLLEEVPIMAAELWSAPPRTSDTSSTPELAAVNRLEKVLPNQAAELWSVRLDVDRLHQTVHTPREEELQLLRETVQELRTDNSRLREEQEQIQDKWVQQYLANNAPTSGWLRPGW